MSTAKPWHIKHPLSWVLVNILTLVFLAILAVWELVPAAYTVLAGRHVQGVVYTVRDCGTDDNGDKTYEQTFLYKDAQGQLQESTSGTDCFNEYSNGEAGAAWYLQSMPGSVVIDDGSSIFYLIFAALDLLGMLVVLGFLAYCLWALIKACRQTETFTRLLIAGLGCSVIIAPLPVVLHFWPPPDGQDSNGPTHNFLAGQTVAAEQRWAVTIQGGQESVVKAPHAGNQCLNLTITLRNVTGQTLTFQTSQFTLYDDQIKSRTTTCPIDAPELQNATLAPGVATTGAIDYEVPASARQFYLAFRPNPQGEDNTGRYIWNISLAEAQRPHEDALPPMVLLAAYGPRNT